MNASATKPAQAETPATFGRPPMFFTALKKRLLATWNKWVPVAYQDENGFHLGSEELPKK